MKAIINKLEVDDRGTRGFTILHKGDKKSKALLKNTLFSLNIYTEVDFDTFCNFFLSEKIEAKIDDRPRIATYFSTSIQHSWQW